MEASEEREHLQLAAKLAGLKLPELVLPESHQIIIGKMRFHYLDWGTAARHPILLLHGGGLNAHTWDLVCLMLRDQYHCIALDQRGHGDSEWEPAADYSIESQVKDIEGMVSKLGLERPLIVGHSMGGFAGMAYAAKHAKTMAGLVLVDIGPEVNQDGAHRIRDFVRQDRELDSVDAFVERAMSFNPMRNPALLRRSLLNNLRNLPNGRWTWKHDPNRFSANLMQDREANAAKIKREIEHITCPTLLMRGANSDVLSDESAERFAKVLPHGRLVRVEKAGHTIQGDNPRALLEALRPFLKEIGL